jgi:fructose-bisphosphate aldolase, class I
MRFSHTRRLAAPLHICRTSKFEAGNEFADELRETARYISTRGKGILASDESNATTGKRLATVGVENTENNRRAWRECLYTAPGLGQYISGERQPDSLLEAANGRVRQCQL